MINYFYQPKESKAKIIYFFKIFIIMWSMIMRGRNGEKIIEH